MCRSTRLLVILCDHVDLAAKGHLLTGRATMANRALEDAKRPLNVFSQSLLCLGSVSRRLQLAQRSLDKDVPLRVYYTISFKPLQKRRVFDPLTVYRN